METSFSSQIHPAAAQGCSEVGTGHLPQFRGSCRGRAAALGPQSPRGQCSASEPLGARGEVGKETPPGITGGEGRALPRLKDGARTALRRRQVTWARGWAQRTSPLTSLPSTLAPRWARRALVPATRDFPPLRHGSFHSRPAKVVSGGCNWGKTPRQVGSPRRAGAARRGAAQGRQCCQPLARAVTIPGGAARLCSGSYFGPCWDDALSCSPFAGGGCRGWRRRRG